MSMGNRCKRKMKLMSASSIKACMFSRRTKRKSEKKGRLRTSSPPTLAGLTDLFPNRNLHLPVHRYTRRCFHNQLQIHGVHVQFEVGLQQLLDAIQRCHRFAVSFESPRPLVRICFISIPLVIRRQQEVSPLVQPFIYPGKKKGRIAQLFQQSRHDNQVVSRELRLQVHRVGLHETDVISRLHQVEVREQHLSEEDQFSFVFHRVAGKSLLLQLDGNPYHSCREIKRGHVPVISCQLKRQSPRVGIQIKYPCPFISLQQVVSQCCQLKRHIILFRVRVPPIMFTG